MLFATPSLDAADQSLAPLDAETALRALLAVDPDDENDDPTAVDEAKPPA